MSEGGRVFLSTVVGAAVGAAAGYLYFTEGGRRLRSQIDPKLDEAMHEIRRLQSTVNKVQAVASEAWRSLGLMTGERSLGPGPLRQGSPS